MSVSGKRLGSSGEKAAATFLESQGYTLVEINYQTRAFEIDIIARHGNTLCFVEVKTRRSLRKGFPKEAVTPDKQSKLVMGAQFYIKEKELVDQRMRFDVVEVLFTGNTPRFTLIQNAFVPG